MSILYILLAILLLGFIVMMHELGHYTVARLCKIGVEEFAVGMGPILFTRVSKKTGIRYSLRAIPLGGFCQFVGEDEENPSPDAFNNQAVWKRALTVAAGPLMNFVVALVFTLAVVAIFGVHANVPVVGQFLPEAPAVTSGLQVGDVITEVNGQPIEYSSAGLAAMSAALADQAADAPIQLVVSRSGESVDVEVMPYVEDGRTLIGITLGVERVGMNAVELVDFSVRYIGNTMYQMVASLKTIFTTKEGFDEAMGPIGIIAFMGENIQQGVDIVLQMVILISLNLGIMNLLPIPALDGGRLVFLAVEGVRRKPVPRDKEALVHLIGLGALLLLILVITAKDIVGLFAGA